MMIRRNRKKERDKQHWEKWGMMMNMWWAIFINVIGDMMLLCGRECCVEFKCRKFNFWLNQREFYTKSLHDLYNIHGWRAHPHIFILSLALSFYLSLSLFFPFRLSFSLSPLSLSLARSVLFFFFLNIMGTEFSPIACWSYWSYPVICWRSVLWLLAHIWWFLEIISPIFKSVRYLFLHTSIRDAYT